MFETRCRLNNAEYEIKDIKREIKHLTEKLALLSNALGYRFDWDPSIFVLKKIEKEDK